MRPDPYVLANELSVARLELATLRADIATYVQVSADQLGEIERLKNDNEKLFKTEEYWLMQAGNMRQERDDAQATITRLRTALSTIDRELQLITGQCGTPDAAEGCRLILKTVERARDAGKAALTKES